MAKGRPKAPTELADFKDLMRFRPSLADTAAWFSVSEDTIERRCQEFESLTFAEFRTKYLGRSKLTLIQKALSMAMDGDRTMLKFCLKNLAGWSEEPAQSAEDQKPLQSIYKLYVEKDELEL